MAIHESGLDNRAQTSRPVERRAVGLWQLMPGTARELGLEVSAARDKRLDPRRSTAAAAALLAQGHARLGDWPLAVAAYNGGVTAIQAATAGLSIPEARAHILSSREAEYGRYLAGVMAIVLLLDNPTLLD